MTVELTKPLTPTQADPFEHAVGLSAVWQKCMSEVYGANFRTLSETQHGQLGRLRKSLGVKQATPVVEFAIRNWGEFAQKAAKQVGSEIYPPKPSVGWLCHYHAIAVLMLHEELQSIAKKQAAKEQAKQEDQLNEATKAMQESKPKQPSITLIQLTQEQWNIYFDGFDDPDDPAILAWTDKITEKYGEWRPAKLGEKGIPCDVEFKKAG